MKQLYLKMLCLMLALMLSLSVISMANASETLIGQKTKDGYTILSVQYAYKENGAVYLYDEDGKTIVTTLANGTKLAVTDGQKTTLSSCSLVQPPAGSIKRICKRNCPRI